MFSCGGVAIQNFNMQTQQHSPRESNYLARQLGFGRVLQHYTYVIALNLKRANLHNTHQRLHWF
jgi:hypothetical protein